MAPCTGALGTAVAWSMHWESSGKLHFEMSRQGGVSLPARTAGSMNMPYHTNCAFNFKMKCHAVFVAVTIKLMVFWFVTPFSSVGGYHCEDRSTICLQTTCYNIPEDSNFNSSMFFISSTVLFYFLMGLSLCKPLCSKVVWDWDSFTINYRLEVFVLLGCYAD